MSDEADKLVERRQRDAIAPVDHLRTELVEAKKARSIPRLQRVIGAATVAAEAQRRVARLAAGEGMPQEVITAANEAANEAATVRLEAQAEAGRILREMRDAGQVMDRPGPKPGVWQGAGANRRPRDSGSEPEIMTVPEAMGAGGDISVSAAEDMARTVRRVADIPDEVREQYVAQAKRDGNEITTKGLLRYAAPPKPEPEGRDGLEVAYDAVVKLAGELLRYDSKSMAAHANNTRRRTQFKKLMDSMRDWVEKADAIVR